ncbi:MAG: hypothetical protein HS108_08055 [Planctomycetes bacterium]|nr:hypothetical protein [Planctomycetota bacterium]
MDILDKNQGYDALSIWELAKSLYKVRIFRGHVANEAVVVWRVPDKHECAVRVQVQDLPQLAWRFAVMPGVCLPGGAQIAPQFDDWRPVVPSLHELALLPVVRHIARGLCWPSGGLQCGPGYIPEKQLLVLEPEVVKTKFANSAAELAARLPFSNAVAARKWLEWLALAVQVPSQAPPLVIAGSAVEPVKSIVADVSSALVEGKPPFRLNRSGQSDRRLRVQLELAYRSCLRVAILHQPQFGAHFDRVLELLLRGRTSGNLHSPEVLVLVVGKSYSPSPLLDSGQWLEVETPHTKLRPSITRHAMTTRQQILQEIVAQRFATAPTRERE